MYSCIVKFEYRGNNMYQKGNKKSKQRNIGCILEPHQPYPGNRVICFGGDMGTIYIGARAIQIGVVYY